MNLHNRSSTHIACRGHVGTLIIAAAFTITLILPHAHALTWDRGFETPGLLGPATVQVLLSSESLFARIVRSQLNGTAPLVNTTSPRASMLITIGGVQSGDTVDNQGVWLSPWPIEVSRSGQHRWIRAPIVGTQPRERDTFALAATMDVGNPFVGSVFMFGGYTTWGAAAEYLASLWVLDLERTSWTPIGPSRMLDASNPDSYTCNGKPGLWDGAPISIPTRSVGIDECWFSSKGSAQTDEFGCPWPTSRQGHSMITVQDSIILYTANFLSRDTVADLWRLRLDDHLQAAIDQQATNIDGNYVYNADQLKYLANPNDPLIDKSRLCPVRWELLTRPDGTSSLKNQPGETPFPPNRWLTTVTVQGSVMLVAGGQKEIDTVAAHSDVWIIDFAKEQLQWVQLMIAPRTGVSVSGEILLPAARSFHAVSIMKLSDVKRHAYDPSLSHLQACGTGNTTVIVVAGGIDSTGATVNFVHLLTGCDGSSESVGLMDASFSTASSRMWTWSLAYQDLWPSDFNAVQIPFANAWAYFDTTFISVMGVVATGYSNNVHVFDVARNTAWIPPQPFRSVDVVGLTPPRLIPSARTLHSSFLVDRLMWVVGGGTNVDNEVWTYDVDRFEWTLVGSHLTSAAFWAPSAQYCMFALDESHRRIIQYGGAIGYPVDVGQLAAVSDMNCTNEVFIYDLTSGTWTNVTQQITSATPWTGTVEEARATGGEVINGYIYPLGRCAMRGAVLGRGDAPALYVIGGYVLLSSSFAGLDNALWKLDLISLRWSLVQESDLTVGSKDPLATRPSPRRFHSVARIDEDRMIMAFGFSLVDGFTTLHDTAWIYSVLKNRWHLMPSGPLGRVSSAVVAYGERIFLFGGGLNNAPGSNDLWSYHVPSDTWTQLPAENPPVMRGRHTLVCSPSTRELFLYGGLFDDLSVHVLDLDEITVGGRLGGSLLPHDWLASLQLNPQLAPINLPCSTNTVGSAIAASSGVSASGSASTARSLYSFATLAAGISYLQSSARSTISTITILDDTTTGGASTRTTRFLSRVTILTQITIQGKTRATGEVDPLTFEPSAANPSDGSHFLANRSLLVCDTASPLDCSFVVGRSDAVSGRCSSAVGATISVRLRDFTFVGGRSSAKGGALLVSNAQVRLENMALIGCWSANFGGAIAMENSDVSLDHSLIRGNSAAWIGGGIYSVNSQLLVVASHVVENRISSAVTSLEYRTYGQGGGLSSLATSVVILNSTFVRNTARAGAAIYASTLQSEVRSRSARKTGIVQ